MIEPIILNIYHFPHEFPKHFALRILENSNIPACILPQHLIIRSRSHDTFIRLHLAVNFAAPFFKNFSALGHRTQAEHPHFLISSSQRFLVRLLRTKVSHKHE